MKCIYYIKKIYSLSQLLCFEVVPTFNRVTLILNFCIVMPVLTFWG